MRNHKEKDANDEKHHPNTFHNLMDSPLFYQQDK